jgi:Domain of unknown function (DUF4440)
MFCSLKRSMLLLAISTTALHAQTKEKAKEKEAKPGAAELVRLENALAAGLVKRDGALFDRYLASKFVYTENDVMIRRDAMLKEVTSGSDTVRAARNEGMEVHQFGSTAAAVTGWMIVDGRGKGGAFTHRYRFTDTWVKRKSAWQLAVAQDYLAPN